MKNEYFKTDGKQIADMLFDAKYFKDSVTRDDMNAVEELIVFLLQSKFETYKRTTKLLERIEQKESK